MASKAPNLFRTAYISEQLKKYKQLFNDHKSIRLWVIKRKPNFVKFILKIKQVNLELCEI